MENRAWFLNTYTEKFSRKVGVIFDRSKNNFSYFDFKWGKRIDPLPKQAHFFVEKHKKATLEYLLEWDFLPNSTGLILANERALEILREVAEGEFQEVPAIITMHDGTVIRDYTLINVAICKKVLNEEKSILLPEEEQEEWQKYKKCYYNKDCLGDSNIVMVDHSSFFMGSEKLRKTVVREKLRGLSFKESYAGIDFFLD